MNTIISQVGTKTSNFSINISQVGSSSTNFVYTGIYIDPDFVSWLASVQAAGGTITSANQIAFNNAFLALKGTTAKDGNSLWSHINQGYFFIGQESLTRGLFVPFYDTTGAGLLPINPSPANYNFSNYTKTGGLQGDGTSTFIDTGIDNNNTAIWPSGSPYRHGYVYLNNNNGSLSGGFPFGTSVGSNTGSNAKVFQASLYNYFNATTGRIWTDATTSNIFGVTQQSPGLNGGWGIPNSYSNGGLNDTVVIGRNRSFKVISATPASSNLVPTPILIGRTTQGFSPSNIIAATFGSSVTASDFTLLDDIINNLISQLS